MILESRDIAEADHLFMTDAWREAWLSAWSNKLSAEDQANPEAVFYRSPQRTKGVASIDTVTPNGQGSHLIPSIRSEYFQVPSQQNLAQFFSAVRHQAAFGDVIVGSHTEAEIRRICEQAGWGLITRNPAKAYSVDCTTGFTGYLATLSSGARAQLYNRRKRLAALGKVSFSTLNTDSESFLSLLNSFHRERWGKDCFCGKNAQFIQRLLQLLDGERAEPILSVMHLDEKPISVLLDIRVGSRRYNLQAGYVEGLAKGLSLGVLHLGYAIEEAMHAQNIHVYDFMAGNGKQTNYKVRFATHETRLIDMIVVRPWWLRMLYQAYDFFKYRREQGANASIS